MIRWLIEAKITTATERVRGEGHPPQKDRTESRDFIMYAANPLAATCALRKYLVDVEKRTLFSLGTPTRVKSVDSLTVVDNRGNKDTNTCHWHTCQKPRIGASELCAEHTKLTGLFHGRR